jgi:hypothetical protein
LCYIGVSVLSSGYAWTIPLLTFFIADLAYTSIPSFSKGLTPGIDQIVSTFSQNGINFLYILTAGIISSLTQKKVMTIRPRMENKIETTPHPTTQVVPTQPETSIITEQPSKTRRLSLKYNVSDFSQNQNGEFSRF